MTVAFIGIGSNVGQRRASCRQALEALETRDIGRVLRCSSLVETEPWGEADQRAFINLVAELETELGAQELLARLKNLEQDLGRVERQRWGPREIDLDILLYGDEVIDSPGLTVPHPRIAERRFVLVSLAELAADLRHPVLNRPLGELLAACRDRGNVRSLGPLTGSPCAKGR